MDVREGGAVPDLVGVEEACTLLQVVPDRIQVMIDEGLLSPVGLQGPQGLQAGEGGEGGEGGAPRFLRAEVMALGELGG